MVMIWVWFWDLQTKAGPVLVAINPFKKVDLYGNDYIEAYKRKTIESPHVYAITDTAIREMIRGFLMPLIFYEIQFVLRLLFFLFLTDSFFAFRWSKSINYNKVMLMHVFHFCTDFFFLNSLLFSPIFTFLFKHIRIAFI